MISVCRRLMQEDCQGLEASLRYIVRSSFETAVTAATVTRTTKPKQKKKRMIQS